MIDDPDNEAEIVADLMNPSKNRNNINISVDDMKRYLEYAARQSVTMTQEAESLLRGYFAATKQIRPSKKNPAHQEA